MWKALLGIFGGGDSSATPKRRAAKPRAAKAKAKSATVRRVKVAAKATSEAGATPRPRKAAAKRRGSRKAKFVWPTEPMKAARKASPPLAADGQGDDPNWSQPTQPLL